MNPNLTEVFSRFGFAFTPRSDGVFVVEGSVECVPVEGGEGYQVKVFVLPDTAAAAMLSPWDSMVLDSDFLALSFALDCNEVFR